MKRLHRKRFRSKPAQYIQGGDICSSSVQMSPLAKTTPPCVLQKPLHKAYASCTCTTSQPGARKPVWCRVSRALAKRQSWYAELDEQNHSSVAHTHVWCQSVHMTAWDGLLHYHLMKFKLSANYKHLHTCTTHWLCLPQQQSKHPQGSTSTHRLTKAHYKGCSITKRFTCSHPFWQTLAL